MKVSERLAGGYAAVVLLLGGMVGVHVLFMSKSASRSRQLSSLSTRLALASTEQPYA